ncbi:hypothetical protein QVD17_37289 [Tagetes erecta]|uniref:S-protein homolog n=1 Tax=Tagetes erecta TaxID=13708 RepID=A0AAD8JTT0_TARER|nr:hypothetical protein QVD17_37289 [Tagetes erecta]
MACTMQFLFLLVLTSYHFYFGTSSFESYEIQVIDGNIENLVAHVFSKDNDLGNKTMTIKDAFHWSFRRDYDESTMFTGEFFWTSDDGTETRKTSFPVFDNDVAKDCGQSILKDHKCFWLVTSVGFYFSKDDPVSTGWELKHNWP